MRQCMDVIILLVLACCLNMEAAYTGCNDHAIQQSCSKFSLDGPPLNRSLLWVPQCIEIAHRIQCSIYLITCRQQNTYSQLYDIPCQTSCHASLAICTRGLEHQSSLVDPNQYRAFTVGRQWISLSRSECSLLPAGGCDQWADYLASLHFLDRKAILRSTKKNARCPESEINCKTMFPKKYRKRNWRKANFTVALEVKISQTMWVFNGNSFHPYLRLYILHKFKSNIHTPNEMMITIPWPSQCVCPNEIVVGQRYLLLTHSIWAYQSLNVSSSSIFLQRTRRNKKKLQCWVGPCRRKNRRGSRDRRRNRPHLI